MSKVSRSRVLWSHRGIAYWRHSTSLPVLHFYLIMSNNHSCQFLHSPNSNGCTTCSCQSLEAKALHHTFFTCTQQPILQKTPLPHIFSTKDKLKKSFAVVVMVIIYAHTSLIANSPLVRQTAVRFWLVLNASGFRAPVPLSHTIPGSENSRRNDPTFDRLGQRGWKTGPHILCMLSPLVSG